MQIEKAAPLVPFSMNTQIINRPRANVKTPEENFLSKQSLKTFENPRTTQGKPGRRKENAVALDPLKSINQIISQCEDAVQQYVSDAGPSKVPPRGVRSYSFKKQLPIGNVKCMGRMNSKGRNTCQQSGIEPENQISSLKNDDLDDPSEKVPRKRSSATNVLVPIRKKSLKIGGEIPGIGNALLKKLYEAKSVDIKRATTSEQERRFIEFCAKVIKHRRIALREVFFTLCNKNSVDWGQKVQKWWRIF